MSVHSIIYNGEFKVEKQIGSGGFSKIYKGTHIITDQHVCIKIQPKTEKDLNILKNEAIIYNYFKNTDGLPVIKYYGSDENNIYIIIHLLDKNLYQLKKKYNTLCLTSILKIGVQLIRLIKTIHSIGLLHRDIKPQNIMIGFNDKNNIIYLIDFGLSKKYVDSKNNHILCNSDSLHEEIIGTFEFVSENVINGIEPSRRDDIISIIYVLLFLYVENKEWKYINNTQKNIENKLFNIQMLYEKMMIPKIFMDLLNNVTQLSYEETPDYELLLTLLEEESKLYDENHFEWM